MRKIKIWMINTIPRNGYPTTKRDKNRKKKRNRKGEKREREETLTKNKKKIESDRLLRKS